MANANPRTLWILTDGKAGDEQPLIGLAEALGIVPELRHVRPGAPFVWLMPWGPIDPREAENRASSPLAPPYPDVCLATGRRAVAYLRRLKRLSPRTCTVFLKDPRTLRHGADLVVVPAHDHSNCPGALTVATMPNRLPAARLAALRAAPPAGLAALPHPRLAVLVGGDSRHCRFTPDDITRIVSGLGQRLDTGASMMITTSRRTPPALTAALSALAKRPGVFLWDGTGDNPYAAMLALAEEVIVTADSTNMIGEACVTGRPVQIFHPSGGHRKIDDYLASLGRIASLGRFPEAPASGGYPPINATDTIAAAVLERWRQINC